MVDAQKCWLLLCKSMVDVKKHLCCNDFCDFMQESYRALLLGLLGLLSLFWSR